MDYGIIIFFVVSISSIIGWMIREVQATERADIKRREDEKKFIEDFIKSEVEKAISKIQQEK